MRQFILMTDTGSDLPDEYYEAHAVEKISLGFTMDGVSYGGDENPMMDVKEFYARLRGGAMPKTFQATPQQARAHLEPHAKAGEDVLLIAFSSGLSGTYNSYVTAAKELAEEYPACKLIVLDSLCASLGQGLLVDYAVKKADSGASIEETAAYVKGLVPALCHYFTVEDLYHLKRGGRVSATTAFVGTMLKIKPVLHVDDEGHLIAIGKAMGRKKSISALVDKMTELSVMAPDDPIFISHGDCEEDVEFLKKLLEKSFGGHAIYVAPIGPVIGTHSGAGTLAVFFVGKHR